MTDDARMLVAQRAERLAWWLLVALVATVPLAIGAPGSQTAIGTWDPFGLPKAAALIMFAAASGVAWAVSMAASPRLNHHPLLWLALATVGWWVVATLTSVSPALSVYGEYMRNDGTVAFVAQVLVLFLAVQLVRGVRRLRQLVVALVSSASVVSAYALLQYLGVDPLRWSEGGFGNRIFSTFGNPDLLGAFLVLPFILAVGVAISTESERHASLAWGAAGLIGAALLLTLVRGAWAAAAVGVIALAVAVMVGKVGLRRLDLAFAGGLAVALAAVGVLAGRQEGLSVAGRLASVLGVFNDGGLGTRAQLWRGAVGAWRARPLIGWGPDAFQRAFARHVTEEYYRQTSALMLADNAHNYYVQLLVTVGAVGVTLVVVAFLWALAASARSVFTRSLPRPRVLYASVWAGLAALLVLFLTTLSMPGVTMWAWMAAGLLVVPLARQSQRRPRIVGGAAVVLGAVALCMAFVASRWLVADTVAARAMRTEDATEQAIGLERALEINPLPQRYRILRAAAYDRSVVEASTNGVGGAGLLPLFTQASRAFEEAASRDDTDLQSRIQLAAGLNQASRLYPGQGYSERALEAASEAVALAPRDPDALTQLSIAQLSLRKFDAAVASAQMATSVLPTYAPAWLALARASEASGDRGSALQAYEKVLEQAPDDEEARLGAERLRKLEGVSP